MKKTVNSKLIKPLYNKEKLQKAIEVLESIDNPFREKLMKFIQSHPDATVTTIIKGVRKVQSFVSKHLGILKTNQMISATKEGKEVHYSLNEKQILETNKAMEILAKAV